MSETTYLYFIYNNVKSNHIYIGITHDLIRRKKSIGKKSVNKNFTYLKAAMNKYGINNFSFVPIEIFNSREEANKAEIFYIKYFRELKKYTVYNIRDGGEGPCGEAMRNHLSEMWRGENAPLAKLTLGQVNEIKKLYKECKYPHSYIATSFNVSKTTISAILSGRHWRDDANVNYKRIMPTKSEIENRNKEMAKKYQNGHTLDDLATLYKMNKKFIRKILVKMNVEVKNLTKENNISENKVKEIFELLNIFSDKEISAKLDTAIYIIKNIRSGKSWTNITGIKKQNSICKSLTIKEKRQVLDLRKSKLFTNKEIADFYCVSDRTLNRILKENMNNIKNVGLV